MKREHQHYWGNLFSCPYYNSDYKTGIICENRSAVRFYDRKSTHSYICRYCASKNNGWKDCSIAQMLSEFYERTEKDV